MLKTMYLTESLDLFVAHGIPTRPPFSNTPTDANIFDASSRLEDGPNANNINYLDPL